MTPDITTLAEYGLSGVCIALIILISLIIHKVFKFIGNHVDHNTQAWNRNSEVLTKLTTKIDEDIKAQQQTAEALRDLQQIIHNQ